MPKEKARPVTSFSLRAKSPPVEMTAWSRAASDCLRRSKKLFPLRSLTAGFEFREGSKS
jgi:hypothetical protein